MLIWAIWSSVVLLSFAALEGWALATNRTTLSRSVWTISKAWPPFPLVVGAVIGFVCAHFWWGGALICYAPT